MDYIAEGLGSNSTPLKLHLTSCGFGDGGVAAIHSGAKSWLSEHDATGFAVLLEMMEQSSKSITDLELQFNPIGNEGASLLENIENNVLPSLTRLCLSQCGIGDMGL